MISTYPSHQTLQSPQSSVPVKRSEHDREQIVYFFLDFSNIKYSGSQIACLHGDGIYCDTLFRLSCSNLRALAQQGRRWASGFSAAALSKQSIILKTQMAEAGIHFEQSEKGIISRREQNVDERIQLEMYRLLNPNVVRGNVVLASGDGAGHQEGCGFLPALQALHMGGYSIEVLSWGHSLNNGLRNWAEHNGRVVLLDPFYENITFIEGGRQPSTQSELQKRMARLNITGSNQR